jgi:hypothetical protein
MNGKMSQWQFGCVMFVVLIVGVMAMGRGAQATEINVPADQSTIQTGIDATADGDTVLVQPGTYVENINFNGKNITVKSVSGNPEDTIIDGNKNGSVVTFDNGEDSTAVLNGFTLTNGSGTLLSGYTHGGAIYVKNADPTIKNMVILNNSVTSSGGGIHFVYSDAILSDSIIRNNIAGDDGGGISTAHSDVTIRNCLIVENKAQDIGGAVAGGGIRIHGYGNPTIINSTIANNSTPGSGGGGIVVYWNTNPVIANCIVYNNAGGEIKTSGNANPVVTYSLVKGGHTGQGNIDTDPLFADATATGGDYHLSDDSPCIDAGTSDNAPETDLEGNERLAPPDMGAYEYVFAMPTADDGDLNIVDSSAPCGGSVSVPVRIQNAPNTVNALGFEVTYDSAMLTYTGFKKGPLAVNFADPVGDFDVNPYSPGAIRIGGYHFLDGIAPGAGGVLVYLKFDIAAECDSSVLEIAALTDDIGSWTATSGSFTPGSVTVCDGDVNDDGDITPADALCVFEKYMTICPTSCGIECDDICGDVNCDGETTPADALCIFNKYLGKACCLD